MKIIGIIAEYNPFHKGHQFHIEQTRMQTDADYVIAIISGPFVQRGGPAIADKYTRARAALLGGVDLVLELPVLYATASAEFFATGAVRTFHQLGIIHALSFGCETNTLAPLQMLAQLLLKEPPEYKEALKKELSNGLSFPKARENALLALCPNLSNEIDLQQPNTILGIEYCKALLQCNRVIQPIAIKRQGGGYHQLEQDGKYSSASSLRKQLANTNSISSIASQIPENSRLALEHSVQYSFPIFDEDFSAIVRYALLQVPNLDYTPYLDVTPELSNRIRKHLFAYSSFHSFVSLLKTKELTYSRICRCLIHILLNITKVDFELAKSIDYVPYIRVLGIKSDSTKLLKAIQQNTNIPILTNPKKGMQQLSSPARRMLEIDCMATHIWNGIAGEKFQHATACEYSRKFLKL